MDATAHLKQIENTGETLLVSVIDAIRDLEDEGSQGETISIADVAKHLGFTLTTLDGSLVAHRAFCDVVKEALFVTGYSEVSR